MSFLRKQESRIKNEKFVISVKVEKLKSEKGNPLLFLPPKRGEIALSTCQLFNLSTKIGSGKRIEERKINHSLLTIKGGKGKTF